MYNVIFEACENGNSMVCCSTDFDVRLYAVINVPYGASEDYGYYWLKDEIMRQAKEQGISTDQLKFFYDDSAKLENDAKCTPDDNPNYWYAVMVSQDDNWSYGSYNYSEALRMRSRSCSADAYIAVIDNRSSNPICVDEIHDFY